MAIEQGNLRSEFDEDYLNYHFKGHQLVYSHTGKDMTGKMMNLWALVMTHMTRDSWFDEFGNPKEAEFYFDAPLLEQWFNLEKRNLSSRLRRTCAALLEKTIHIRGENDSWIGVTLFSKIGYSKGTLYIKPNKDLRELYLISSDALGHSKIDNQVFLSLPHTKEKRIFEFLCRFRSENFQLHPISIKNLQIMLNVRNERGVLLKSSYESDRRFITGFIEPALAEIDRCSHGKFELLVSHNGTKGYELSKSTKTGEMLIRFLVSWKQEEHAISETEIHNYEKQAVGYLKKFDLYAKKSPISNDSISALELAVGALQFVPSRKEQYEGLFNFLESLKAEQKAASRSKDIDPEIEETKNELDSLLSRIGSKH